MSDHADAKYCETGKIIYDAMSDARKSARLHKRGKSGLYPYQCKVCQGIHLTSSRKKGKPKRRNR